MTKGQHKITMTVEIDGGDLVITQEQEYSAGNPLLHASEFFRNSVHPIRKIKKALKGIYGEIEREVNPITYNGKGIEDAVEQAKANGGSVFRFVLIKGGLTFTGEAMHAQQFINMWENLKDDGNLNRVEYGIPSDTKFDYKWSIL